MSVRELVHGPKRKIYLAGPMSGIPCFNFPRFIAVSKVLRACGHEVFNPAEADIERHGGVDISKDNMTGSQKEARENHKFFIRDALAQDLAYICNVANAIVLLPGWERSNGVRAEHATAVALQAGGEEFALLYLTEDDCAMMERAGCYMVQEAAE